MENFLLYFTLCVYGNYHIMEPLLEIDGKTVHISDFWLSNSGYLDGNLNPSGWIQVWVFWAVCSPPKRQQNEVHGVSNTLVFLGAVLSQVNCSPMAL